MTLGRGLESLIPPTSGGSSASDAAPNQAAGSGTSPSGARLPELPRVQPNPEAVKPAAPPPAREYPSPRPAVRDEGAKAGESVFQIEVSKITPNPFQPRRDFNELELQELANSIREFGVIQPLVVCKIENETETGTSVEYQIIAGERRWRASKMAGLERVPVVIRRNEPDKAKLELAVVENVQRSDLNPIEAARAYARLQDEFNLTQREIAARIGKSREAVGNALRLLSAPTFIQDAILAGKINESQARVLLGVGDVMRQKKMFDQLLNERMSVRALQNRAVTRSRPEEDYFARRLEERIGAPVTILRRGGRGKLVINFFSDEEFQELLQKIMGEDSEQAQ